MTPNINNILRNNPRPCRYGAQIGAGSYVDTERTTRVYLQRVRFVDGDYALDGTYWGGGRDTAPLWCAFDAEDSTRVYVRAWGRGSARAKVVAEFPTLDSRITRGNKG